MFTRSTILNAALVLVLTGCNLAEVGGSAASDGLFGDDAPTAAVGKAENPNGEDGKFAWSEPRPLALGQTLSGQVLPLREAVTRDVTNQSDPAMDVNPVCLPGNLPGPTVYWHWNGYACVVFHSCYVLAEPTCSGADCDKLYQDPDDCNSEHQLTVEVNVTVTDVTYEVEGKPYHSTKIGLYRLTVEQTGMLRLEVRADNPAHLFGIQIYRPEEPELSRRSALGDALEVQLARPGEIIVKVVGLVPMEGERAIDNTFGFSIEASLAN